MIKFFLIFDKLRSNHHPHCQIIWKIMIFKEFSKLKRSDDSNIKNFYKERVQMLLQCGEQIKNPTPWDYSKYLKKNNNSRLKITIKQLKNLKKTLYSIEWKDINNFKSKGRDSKLEKFLKTPFTSIW